MQHWTDSRPKLTVDNGRLTDSDQQDKAKLELDATVGWILNAGARPETIR